VLLDNREMPSGFQEFEVLGIIRAPYKRSLYWQSVLVSSEPIEVCRIAAKHFSHRPTLRALDSDGIGGACVLMSTNLLNRILRKRSWENLLVPWMPIQKPENCSLLVL